MGGGRNGRFRGAPIFGQNPGKYIIFPQKDARSGRPKNGRSYHHPSHPLLDALFHGVFGLLDASSNVTSSTSMSVLMAKSKIFRGKVKCLNTCKPPGLVQEALRPFAPEGVSPRASPQTAVSEAVSRLMLLGLARASKTCPESVPRASRTPSKTPGTPSGRFLDTMESGA